VRARSLLPKSQQIGSLHATLARVSGRDLVITALLIFGFAAFVTIHVWLAVRLIIHVKPRIRGVAALFVPPLAPLWAYREGFQKGAILWVVSLALYVIARLAVHL
jgi:hypothetical protein